MTRIFEGRLTVLGTWCLIGCPLGARECNRELLKLLVVSLHSVEPGCLREVYHQMTSIVNFALMIGNVYNCIQSNPNLPCANCDVSIGISGRNSTGYHSIKWLYIECLARASNRSRYDLANEAFCSTDAAWKSIFPSHPNFPNETSRSIIKTRDGMIITRNDRFNTAEMLLNSLFHATHYHRAQSTSKIDSGSILRTVIWRKSVTISYRNFEVHSRNKM